MQFRYNFSIRPGGGFVPAENNDEDDYFHGDFSYFNKPKKPVLETCGIVVVCIHTRFLRFVVSKK